MTFDVNGNWSARDTSTIISDGLTAIISKFGASADIQKGSNFRKLIEAFGALPLAETESIMGDIVRQMFPDTATGQNLDGHLNWFGFTRKLATRSTGTVNVTLKTTLTTPPQPDPFFPAQSLTFLDSAGRQFKNTANVSVNGTTSLSIAAESVLLGSEFNILASAIVDVQFENSTISTRWNDNVQSFTNNAAFAGGQDKESDRLFRQRALVSRVGKETCSLDGLVAALQNTSGITSVTGKENTDDATNQDNTLFQDTGTGTASELVNSAGGAGVATRIARKITVAANTRLFVQYTTFKVTHGGSAPTVKIRFETDSSGSPSGALLNSKFEITGVQPPSVTLYEQAFANGAYISGGVGGLTFWLVFEMTGGSATFDGGTGGSAGDVKVFKDAAWANAATITKLNSKIVGGIPPHAFRMFVDGGTSADVADAIWDNKPAGILSDGDVSSTTVDRSGVTQTVYFNRVTLVPVYIDITVKKNAEFVGNANTIKDIIVEYIGGTDSENVIHPGLKAGEILVRNEIISRVLDDDNVVGTVDVTILKVDIVDPPVGTSNLTPLINQKFKIASLNDIDVALID